RRTESIAARAPARGRELRVVAGRRKVCWATCPGAVPCRVEPAAILPCQRLRGDAPPRRAAARRRFPPPSALATDCTAEKRTRGFFGGKGCARSPRVVRRFDRRARPGRRCCRAVRR